MWAACNCSAAHMPSPCPDAESLHVAGGEQSVELLLVDDRDAQFLGLVAFEPGLAPTTTQSVFLLTDPEALPPRRSMASLADSREKCSRVPVTTTLLPSNV